MLIQKTFHIQDGIEATRTQLADLRACRRVFEGVKAATLNPDGSGHVEFQTGNGFAGHVDVVQLATDDPNQILFRSKSGNIDLAGVIECVPIREQLTEVQLTLEYAIKSPVHSVLDAVTASVDRFVNRQLRRLQAHFAGAALPAAARHFPQNGGFPGQPQLAH